MDELDELRRATRITPDPRAAATGPNGAALNPVSQSPGGRSTVYLRGGQVPAGVITESTEPRPARTTLRDPAPQPVSPTRAAVNARAVVDPEIAARLERVRGAGGAVPPVTPPGAGPAAPAAPGPIQAGASRLSGLLRSPEMRSLGKWNAAGQAVGGGLQMFNAADPVEYGEGALRMGLAGMAAFPPTAPVGLAGTALMTAGDLIPAGNGRSMTEMVRNKVREWLGIPVPGATPAAQSPVSSGSGKPEPPAPVAAPVVAAPVVAQAAPQPARRGPISTAATRMTPQGQAYVAQLQQMAGEEQAASRPVAPQQVFAPEPAGPVTMTAYDARGPQQFTGYNLPPMEDAPPGGQVKIIRGNTQYTARPGVDGSYNEQRANRPTFNGKNAAEVIDYLQSLAEQGNTTAAQVVGQLLGVKDTNETRLTEADLQSGRQLQGAQASAGATVAAAQERSRGDLAVTRAGQDVVREQVLEPSGVDAMGNPILRPVTKTYVRDKNGAYKLVTPETERPTGPVSGAGKASGSKPVIRPSAADWQAIQERFAGNPEALKKYMRENNIVAPR